jgi:arylsulfatase A-like enzyme
MIYTSHRDFAVFLITAFFCCGLFADSEFHKKPNIILMMTDDQGWGQMGYYQHPYLKTPHLDNMASHGLRFDRFYAAASVCSPTRASVLTGRIPNRTGVPDHGFRLRHQEKTLPQTLKAVGYANMHIGKWHLDGIGQMGVPILRDDPFGPGTFGFQDWLSMTNFYDLDPVMSRNGIFEEFKGDTSDIAVDEAIKFIKSKHELGQPSLTVIWYPSPHYPCRALPKDKEPFKNLGLKGVVQSVLAEIVAIDRSVGTLRKTLRDMGIEKDTILFFSSDNGGYHGHDIENGMGGLRGAKSSLWEGGIRVPGIIEWPGHIKPRITTYPACTTDIFPTIVDLLDLPKSSMLEPIDGVSLVPLFQRELPQRDFPLAFFQPMFKNIQALIDNDYKIVGYFDRKTQRRDFQLYNLKKDPAESIDLAHEMPEKLKEMVGALAKIEKSVVASEKGADYPEPPRIKTIRPPNWVDHPHYRPYFDDFVKRQEYRGQIEGYYRKLKENKDKSKRNGVSSHEIFP